jgi:hypothetical protein
MQASNNVTQSNNETEERQIGSIRLPRALWKATRLEAVEAETTIGAFIEEAIREKLAKRKRKG